MGPLFEEFFQERNVDNAHTSFPPRADENEEDRQLSHAAFDGNSFISFDVHDSLWRSKVIRISLKLLKISTLGLQSL